MSEESKQSETNSTNFEDQQSETSSDNSIDDKIETKSENTSIKPSKETTKIPVHKLKSESKISSKQVSSKSSLSHSPNISSKSLNVQKASKLIHSCKKLYEKVKELKKIFKDQIQLIRKLNKAKLSDENRLRISNTKLPKIKEIQEDTEKNKKPEQNAKTTKKPIDQVAIYNNIDTNSLVVPAQPESEVHSSNEELSEENKQMFLDTDKSESTESDSDNNENMNNPKYKIGAKSIVNKESQSTIRQKKISKRFHFCKNLENFENFYMLDDECLKTDIIETLDMDEEEFKMDWRDFIKKQKKMNS